MGNAKKVILIATVAVILAIVTHQLFLSEKRDSRQATPYSKQYPPASDMTLADAMRDFASKSVLDKRKAFERIRKELRPGMAEAEVVKLMGNPEKKDGETGLYTLWYSSFVEIKMDAEGKLVSHRVF